VEHPTSGFPVAAMSGHRSAAIVMTPVPTEEAAMNKAPTPTAHPAPDALGDVWELDLTQARDRLIAARAHQRSKDSTSNRAHVAECLAQIDAILDMYLGLQGFRAGLHVKHPNRTWAWQRILT
jgi:hypothetical protein